MKIPVLLFALTASTAALADPYGFFDWGPLSADGLSATGTATLVGGGTVTATLTSSVPLHNVVYDPMSFNYFTGYESTYTSSAVGNLPGLPDLVSTQSDGTIEIVFSSAVESLAFDIVSLGASGSATKYAFDKSFVIASEGGGVFGDGSLTNTGVNSLLGDTLLGEEGHGTIVFDGSISSIRFDITNAEAWAGFNMGGSNLQAVPEPATMAALGLGALALLRKRRR